VQCIAVCLDNEQLVRTAVQLEFGEAFNTIAGVDPFDAPIDILSECVAADEGLTRSIGADRDTWLDLIMTTIIAPRFDRDRLTVIEHYPASKAALARLCPADPRVADRFEVFFGDMELANGYVELTDAAEQRHRIESDLARRKRQGRPTRPWDRHLVAALESGMPECAGVAVGLERLQMVLDGTDDIRNVTSFGFDTANA